MSTNWACGRDRGDVSSSGRRVAVGSPEDDEAVAPYRNFEAGIVEPDAGRPVAVRPDEGVEGGPEREDGGDGEGFVEDVAG